MSLQNLVSTTIASPSDKPSVKTVSFKEVSPVKPKVQTHDDNTTNKVTDPYVADQWWLDGVTGDGVGGTDGQKSIADFFRKVDHALTVEWIRAIWDGFWIGGAFFWSIVGAFALQAAAIATDNKLVMQTGRMS